MRPDGRQDDELRRVQLDDGFLSFAQGSTLISMGNTRVICAAMVEEGVPGFLRGTEQGWLTAEYDMLPYATPTRGPRQRDQKKGRSHEIQRMIGRALRAVVDLTKIPSKTVWCDCDVIQADGGTRCAALTGCFLALMQVNEWLHRKRLVTGSIVRDSLAAVSVGVWENRPLLDLCYREDVEAAVDMNVVMTGSGRLIEVQAAGEGHTFTRGDLEGLLDLAGKGIGQLVEMERQMAEEKGWSWS